MTLSQSFDYIQMCGIVWAAEMLSDWIKHSFITKFNFIKSTVYGEYALLLAGDVTGIGHEGVNLDHSHAVVKRIGLAQVPLVCVLARYLTEAARYSSWSRETILLVILVVWCILLALKYALGRRLADSLVCQATECTGTQQYQCNTCRQEEKERVKGFHVRMLARRRFTERVGFSFGSHSS